MLRHALFAVLTFWACAPTSAAIFTAGNVNGGGTSLNLSIPDGNYPIGTESSIVVGGLGNSLTDVNVTLNISGGWNGDLYGYLSYNGTLVMLLNRVGTGSGDAFQNVAGCSTAGFNNITLDDSASASIHTVASPVSGSSYLPDGGSLASFNDMNPNGTWTLVLADGSLGSTSTLEGWSLEITAVPEPVDWALAMFGAVFVGAGITRHYRRSRTVAQSS